MNHPLRKYFYEITDKNIRKTPLVNRDESRLFVYDTKTDTVTFDIFRNIAKYLPEHSLMVLNNTGVIPARVLFRKDTGGKLNGLILVNEGFDEEGAVPCIVDEQIFPGRKVCLLGEYWFTITRQNEQRFYLKPEFDRELLLEILLKCGSTPTPFYLGKMELGEEELRDRYQTVFAKNKKSVAAPTASLHFTEEVFVSLRDKGVEQAEVTLDVGLGTFADVEDKNVEGKYLHYEKFFIGEDSTASLREAVRLSRPIIAVGTTTVRTLESSVEFLKHESEKSLASETNIFIMPPYEFKVVDHLITNFHVPQSSLMALVDAFLKHKKAKRDLVELYEIAIKEGFQFYSFGDSMLIL